MTILQAATQDDDDEGGEDGSRVRVVQATRTVLPTRWQTKVFAVSCVKKIIQAGTHSTLRDAQGRNPHLDQAAARAMKHDGLVLKLGEIVRTSFIAATAQVDQLRQAGLETLEAVIETFSTVEDADVEGHRPVLEQYQAQVMSALRPAFADDVSPVVRFTACQVTAAWASAGVSADVDRLIGLLAKVLGTFDAPPDASYNERATTMLRLGVLKAFAGLYRHSQSLAEADNSLTAALKPHLPALKQSWEDALRDYAFVSLPPEYGKQVPDEGRFYFKGSRTTVRGYYEQALPEVACACAATAELMTDASPTGTFYLVMGLVVRSLCVDASHSSTPVLLRALHHVVRRSNGLVNEPELLVEVLQVLLHTVRVHGMARAQAEGQRAEVLPAVVDVVHALVASDDPSMRVTDSNEDVANSCLGQVMEILLLVLGEGNNSSCRGSTLATALNALAALPSCSTNDTAR